MLSFKNNADLLQRVLDQTLEHAFVLIDPQGRIADWSAGAEHLFGYSREEIVGQRVDAIFTPADLERGVSELELRTAALDATSEDDRWQRRADGSRFWAAGSVTALRDDAGELLGYIKVLRDRTDMREQIDLLRARLHAARGADQRKDVAMATLSHELRNLLMAQSHLLQQLRSPEQNEVRRERLAALLEEHIAVLQRLSEDLLDAQRLKAHKTPLTLISVQLQALLANVFEAARPRAVAKQLSMELLTPEPPIVVNGDAARLHQVFANLIDNAIKYTPAGGSIWVKATTEDGQAVVHVEDNGAGVPPDMLSRIFELFTQVDSTGSHQGLGIGLALVHELVELHGGSVQARSEGEGKGSQFSVRLPLEDRSG